METKNKIVHKLKKVKLIIGNGFDLHCHLKTSYSDYFLYDKTKLDILHKWIDEFKNKVENYLNFYSNNHKAFWVRLEKFDCFNVWDILFYIISSENSNISNWKWCDIETTIAKYLLDKKTNYVSNNGFDFNFELIYKILNGEPSSSEFNIFAYIIAGFIYKKNNEEKFDNKKEFYYFLLSELKLFERNFGNYIYSQHYYIENNSSSLILSNEAFKKEASKTLKTLCKLKNITSLDTFNYDTPECEEIKSIVHNINGPISWPIFGIDSDTFKAPDTRYIFTKTNRRLEFEMFNEKVEPLFNYENIIIFGCSLNIADYNYFFSIFDNLDIINTNNTSKIVFAYSIYDKNKSEIIQKKLQESVFLLFQEYSKYKGNNIYPSRLLEILMFQKKVIFLEIPFDNTIKSEYFKK